MALINCKECNHLISDSATSCPNCGFKNRSKKIGIGVLALIFLVFIVVLIFSFRSRDIEKPLEKPLPATNTPNPPAPTATPTPIPISASDLLIKAKKLIQDKNLSKADDILFEITFNYKDSSEAAEAKKLRDDIVQIKKLALSQKSAAAAQILKGLHKTYDEINEIGWYSPPKTPLLASHLNPYLGMKKSGAPFLRRVHQYYGEDWLFIESITISVDGTIYKFTNDKIQRDNSSGDVWEWSDEAMTTDDYNMYKSIASSQKTILRFDGNKYYKDHVVTKAEKDGINQILDAYDKIISL